MATATSNPQEKLPNVTRHVPLVDDDPYSLKDYTDLTHLADALDEVEVVYEDDQNIGPAYGRTAFIVAGEKRPRKK